MTCAGKGEAIESLVEASNGSATAVTTGGPSTASSPTDDVSTGEGEPATTARASKTRKVLVIAGWLCDDSNPFGHRVCREIRAPGEGFSAALVLTAGDSGDGGMERFDVPPEAMRWLLEGPSHE